MTEIPDDERAERTSVRSWRVVLPIGYINYNEDVHVDERGISFGYMKIPWSEIDEARASLQGGVA